MKVTKNSSPRELIKLKPKPKNWEQLQKANMINREDYSDFIAKLVQSKDIKGTIVECGVGAGKSFKCFAELFPDDVPMWGFDSFEGFPDVSPIDRHSARIKKGFLSKYTYQDAQKLFKPHANVKLVRGFFDKTLDQYDGSPIMLLHLDCDIYGSYKTCLNELYDMVVDGGVIMFDEYYREYWTYGKYAGAPLAIDEFFSDKTLNMRYCPGFGGKAYMIKGEA